MLRAVARQNTDLPLNQAYGLFLWDQHQYDDDAPDGPEMLHRDGKSHDSLHDKPQWCFNGQFAKMDPS